jgi:hypothetical protein
MESQKDIVAATVNLIDDVNAARCPIEEHRAAMQGRRVERGVPVALSRPSGDVAIIEYLDLASMRVTHPHEGTTFANPAPAAALGGVARNRRPGI